jgi:AraC family transcriptional regulator
MHTHAGALFGMMLDGGFATRIMGRDVDYRAGSAWTEPAEERHANRAGARGARVLVLQPASNSPCLEPIARGLLDEVLTIEATGLLGDAERLEAECARPDDLSSLVVEGTALSMLVRAARLFRARAHHARAPRWLTLAVEYLHAHRCDAVQLSDVARAVGVAPSQLAHGFRERLGTTPGEYLRRLRVEWAAVQLRDGHAAVAEVALRAGFCDQSHFTRVFRRHYGMTPAAWRRSEGGTGG